MNYLFTLKIYYLFLIISIPLFFNYSYPQSDSSEVTQDIYSEIIDNTAEDIEEESDNILEDLEYMKENPVNLNNADIFDLQKIPFISTEQAEGILEYRNKFGRIFSPGELLLINGFDKNLINLIKPFVVTETGNNSSNSLPQYAKNNTSRKWGAEFRSRMYFALQKKKGFKDNKFEGSPLKNYNRVKFHMGKSAGINILSDKDEGERKLNDFTSFNIWVKNISFLKSFVLGDYCVEAGQGLVLWSSYTSPLGIDLFSPVMRSQKNIKPYTSSGESGFLRGAASTIYNGNFSLTLFYSDRSADTNIDSSSGIITSIKTDGYHRTVKEINKKENSKEVTAGSVFEYHSKNFIKTGLILTYANLDKPLKRNFMDPSDRFVNYSFYYDLFIDPAKISGETAFDNHNIAVINNIMCMISRKIISIASFRYYSPFYNSLQGLGFGEGSGTNNEIGFYSGLSYNSGVGKFLFYYDVYKYIRPGVNDIFPRKGRKISFSWISGRLSGCEFTVRYNFSQNQDKEPLNNIRIAGDYLKSKIRLEFKKYYRRLVIKSRIDYVYLTNSLNDLKESGFMISQDITYSPGQFLKLYGRMIFFGTKSFQTAVYEYENDLYGFYKSVALFGNGTRWYFILQISPLAGLKISLKYSETFKPGSKSSGSGYTLIEGDSERTAGLQLDFFL